MPRCPQPLLQAPALHLKQPLPTNHLALSDFHIVIGQGLDIVWALPAVKNMPGGTRIQETGDAEVMGEVFSGFATAMTTGLMLVLVVLILLFGSVFHAFTILGSLPLSVGGVAAALWLTNSAVSMPVVIGILMLMGIVTKNAIMLVDFAIEEVKNGVPRKEAIIDAGRKRARPIVVTTIAMSAGMVPAAMALGDGGEFRAPMAIAVMGGLLVSTLLSLAFVPSFYTIMDDASNLVGRLFNWLVRLNRPDDQDAPVRHGAKLHVLPRGRRAADRCRVECSLLQQWRSDGQGAGGRQGASKVRIAHDLASDAT